MSDILPTGWQAAVNAEIELGSTVAIFGACPVGLLAAASARLLGAKRIFMMDQHEYRLDYAVVTYGVEPIDFSNDGDPAERIIEATDSRGVDASIDAVGFEAKGSMVDTALATLKIEGSSGVAIRQAMAATKRGGIVSVLGVYAGWIHGFLFSDAFDKGLSFKMGQTHTQRFMPEPLGEISNGKLKPEAIVTHRMPLADAARGYQIFNDEEENCRKAVLTA